MAEVFPQKLEICLAGLETEQVAVVLFLSTPLQATNDQTGALSPVRMLSRATHSLSEKRKWSITASAS